MLHSLHMFLIGNSYTRRYQRRLVRLIRHAVRCSDAYGDLCAIARRSTPDAVLDIGSYRGDTIVRFIDELKVPIHAFEPTPESYQYLMRRFAGKPSVILHNCALSDHLGKQRFFCNRNPQTNSLLDTDSGNESSFAEDTNHVEEMEVTLTTLDSWASKNLPTGGKILVKADVQGAEGLLLDGGKKTFGEQVVAFYSEAQILPMYKEQISFCELHARLTDEFGFFLFNVYPCLHDAKGKAAQLDALWVKETALHGSTANCHK